MHAAAAPFVSWFAICNCSNCTCVIPTASLRFCSRLLQMNAPHAPPACNTCASVICVFCASRPQLVTDLGSVFKVIGGSCGAFFIFGMPGAFCLQVVTDKNIISKLDQ